MNTSHAGRGDRSTRATSMLTALADRVRGLELRRSGEVGRWRLLEDEQGRLIAQHSGGRQVVLAAPYTEED